MTRPRLEYGGTEYVCLDKNDLPHELATVFANLDAKGQAEFFSFVALAADRWEKAPAFQWEAMAEQMDATARRALIGMAEHVTETV